MADQDDEVQLFGQCNICIVCSKDLDESTADKVCICPKPFRSFNLIVCVLTLALACCHNQREWRRSDRLSTTLNISSSCGIYASPLYIY